MQLEDGRPKRRKKLETSRSSRFADIKEIRRTQLEVNTAENGKSDGDESATSEIDDDCIVERVGGENVSD